MSESSPFRAEGDNEYIWPPEPYDTERTYPRVSKLLEGEPKPAITGWNRKVIVEFTIANLFRITSCITEKQKPEQFDLDQAWWTEELAKAQRQHDKMQLKAEAWDRGEIDQKTRPNSKVLQRHLDMPSVERVTKYLKHLPDMVRNEAARRGTAVHKYLEKTMNNQPIGDIEFIEHYNHGLQFLKDYDGIEFLEVESVVYSDTYGYAGQFDVLLKVPTALMRTIIIDEKTGELWTDKRDTSSPYYDPDYIIVLADWKTGDKGIKEGIAFQMAFYAKADFIGREDGTKSPIPHIDEFWGLSVTAEGYQVIPVEVNDEVWNKALACREMSDWLYNTSKTVLGQPYRIAA